MPKVTGMKMQCLELSVVWLQISSISYGFGDVLNQEGTNKAA
jgi:hypothetical protein